MDIVVLFISAFCAFLCLITGAQLSIKWTEDHRQLSDDWRKNKRL